MPQGRHRAGRGTPPNGDSTAGGLANENRLRALGEAVDEKTGVKRGRRGRPRWSLRRRLTTGFAALVILIAAIIGGGYFYAQYRFNLFHKVNISSLIKRSGNGPFNVLIVGSDSRVGLTGLEAQETGAGSVAGQRSDVVKIAHIDPQNKTISMISIPRDTMIAELANQSLYGTYNRINTTYSDGASLLVRTVEANFGIPINHVVQVSFGGLIKATEAVGGVWLNFPYPVFDPYSDLDIKHAGCQLVTGFQALAVARSRHYYYNVDGGDKWPGNNASSTTLYNLGWRYDGTSDYGRIDRQNTFVRALIASAKRKRLNPIALNSFISDLPQGITLDSNWSLNELLSLALTFDSFNPSEMATYTMPVTGGTVTGLGDVLFVEQPQAQELLEEIFGSELSTPKDPPPDSALQPNPPSSSTTTTTLRKSSALASLTADSQSVTINEAASTKSTATSTTTTTEVPGLQVATFDPTTCSPT